MTGSEFFGTATNRGACCGKPVGCQIVNEGCLHKVEKREWQERAAKSGQVPAWEVIARAERERAERVKLACWEIDRDPWECPHFSTREAAEAERADYAAENDGNQDGPIRQLPYVCDLVWDDDYDDWLHSAPSVPDDAAALS